MRGAQVGSRLALNNCMVWRGVEGIGLIAGLGNPRFRSAGRRGEMVRSKKVSRMARSDLALTAFAACMLAPAAAEARTVLVCHSEWTRCVALEALAPAYFQGRTLRMQAMGGAGPTSLTGAAPPVREVDPAYRDYFFTEDGYFIRDGEGVAFQNATFAADGRLCAAGGAGDSLCAYLVRMQPDQFGAAASNAICFAAETGDEALATLVQCAAGEWGGDRFNLRVRAMVANLFGRREEAPAPTASPSCAYTPQGASSYALDCAQAAPAAPAAASLQSAPADDGCAYEARAEGGFVLNCTASPAAPAAEPRSGLFALLPGFRDSAPREPEQNGPACAYVNRNGGYFLECD
jgi:hypothetical protein